MDIRLQFIIGLVAQVIGMSIPGIWIVIISIKVLGIRIPRIYLTRTILSALITAGIVFLIKFLPFKDFLISSLGTDFGGILYTIIMVVGGVLLYMTIGILIGAFTREDGRFWKSVTGSIPFIKQLTGFLFAWGKFVLNHVPNKLKVEEFKWITTTKPEQLEKDKEFMIKDDFESKYGKTLKKGQDVKFNVKLDGIKQEFYHVYIHIKLDMKKIPGADFRADMVNDDSEYVIKFSLPDTIDLGYHELYLDVEMYTEKQEKRRWGPIDFAFKWFDETIKYIEVVDANKSG